MLNYPTTFIPQIYKKEIDNGNFTKGYLLFNVKAIKCYFYITKTIGTKLIEVYKMKFYSKKNIKISIRSIGDISIGTVDEDNSIGS